MKIAIFSLAMIFAAGAAAAQDSAATAWSPSARSTARLIAAGPLEDGVYRAGVEVKLNPKTITYWRMPGEAGVPPAVSFDGSQNLTSAEMLYPVPLRLKEAGGVEAFGYEGQVIFPLKVIPADPTQPVILAMAFSYAACEKICVPASAAGTLTLTPAASASAHAAAIARAEAEIPRSVAGGVATVSPLDTGDALQWRVATAPEARTLDLFAEGPDGFYFKTRADGAPGQFLMSLTDFPKDAPLRSIPLRLTLRGARGPSELTMSLDAALAKP